VENGNRGIRRNVALLIDHYSRNAEDHAEANIQSTSTTAIISVVTILIVGLIIAPILTKAEMRKFRAILYFLKIPKDVLPQMIKNCEYCLNMNNEQRYIEI
jgi:ABC-type spermidine/putrescine transport system permease subunit I